QTSLLLNPSFGLTTVRCWGFPHYYDDTFPSTKEQMVFEKNVFNKTSRTESEIAFFGGMTIVYKSSIDLFLYVVGSSHENEVNSGGWGDKEGLSMGEWLGVWGGG
uniref:Coatomer subunit zeta n=1 Tax=Prolemur simus TaxID=1328070 RepID=A0A8C8YZB2_PROSS